MVCVPLDFEIWWLTLRWTQSNAREPNASLVKTCESPLPNIPISFCKANIPERSMSTTHSWSGPLSNWGRTNVAFISQAQVYQRSTTTFKSIYTSITKRTCQSSVAVWRPILPKVPITALQVNHPFNPAFHESLNSELIDRIWGIHSKDVDSPKEVH